MSGETVISVDCSQITVSLVVLIKLICSLETDNINLHVLCYIEHRMEEQKLLQLTLPGYTFGSSFCFVYFCS